MPGGGRNITKKAIAWSPVQSRQIMAGMSSQNSHPLLETGPSSATESPILLLYSPPRETPSVMISGYLVNHVCPKPQGADTV